MWKDTGRRDQPFADYEEVSGVHEAAHVLVVGGTGILRPAVDELARRGHPVTVVARREVDTAPRVFVAAVDACDAQALRAALEGATSTRGPFEIALVYAPFAPAASIQTIAGLATGRLVHVLTSELGAPGTERAELDHWAPDGAGGRSATQRVILGWKYGPEGSRWHTPEEVSRGVLAAFELATPETTVGRLRPWSERPSG